MNLKTIGDQLVKHSPAILTGFAVAGVVSTAVMAAQATPKALTVLRNEMEDRDYEEMSNVDILRTVWRFYAPAATVGLLTISAIVLSNRINSQKVTALAGAYSLVEESAKTYQKKVLDTLGESKEGKLRDDIAQEAVSHRSDPLEKVYSTKNGSGLCYEAFTGRYFTSDIEFIRQAENQLNKRVIDDAYASLNNFYGLLNLPETQIGDELGWNSNNLMEIRYSTALYANAPCLVIDYVPYPKTNYDSAFD